MDPYDHPPKTYFGVSHPRLVESITITKDAADRCVCDCDARMIIG